MTNESLFINLIHRLGKYPEAVVLAVALEQHADEQEFKTTSVRISLDLLGGVLEKKQVQRALDRLAERGLIELRTHANYRTHIKVDRAAVEALLRTPVSDYLPGLRSTSFPFLEHIQSAEAADAPA